MGSAFDGRRLLSLVPIDSPPWFSPVTPASGAQSVLFLCGYTERITSTRARGIVPVQGIATNPAPGTTPTRWPVRPVSWSSHCGGVRTWRYLSPPEASAARVHPGGLRHPGVEFTVVYILEVSLSIYRQHDTIIAGIFRCCLHVLVVVVHVRSFHITSTTVPPPTRTLATRIREARA